RARIARLHGDRAGPLGGAPAAGVSDLRARMAGAPSARRARLLLSLSRQVRDAALRLRARDAHGIVDAAFGVYRRERSEVVDHRAVDPVFPSHRTLPAPGSVPARSQSFRRAT